MPAILDVAIGTVFVFLLFSLVLSALNELIVSALSKREEFLQLGLKELLGDNDKVKTLCTHGLVSAFSESTGKNANKPSYIPSGAFVSSLLDLIVRDWSKTDPNKLKDAGAAAPGIESIRDSLNKLDLNSKLRQSLISLLDASGHDLTAFKSAVEGWFNASMERVSGWYKSDAQKWMFCIGFLLAGILNVDSIRIVQVLSINPKVRDALVTQASQYVEKKSQQAKLDADQTHDQTALDPEKAITNFKSAVADLGGAGIPLGWNPAQLHALNFESFPAWKNSNVCDWVMNAGGWMLDNRGQLTLLVAGWLLSALAASLGAPFWFDLLSRFVNIRNAGKAPEEKDPTQADGHPKPLADLNRTPAPAPVAASTATASASTAHVAVAGILP